MSTGIVNVRPIKACIGRCKFVFCVDSLPLISNGFNDRRYEIECKKQFLATVLSCLNLFILPSNCVVSIASRTHLLQ